MIHPARNRRSIRQAGDHHINASAPNIVEIIVEIALPVPLARSFDYLLPENSDQPAVGARVMVSFGNRKLVGIVRLIKHQSDWDIAKLKPIIEVIDTQDCDAVITTDLHTLLHWCSQYYQHPIGEVFSTAIPAKLRKGEPNERPTLRYWQLTPEGKAADPHTLQRAPKQQALLNFMQQTYNRAPEQPISELSLREQFKNTIVKQLANKNLIADFEQTIPPDFAWKTAIRVAHKPFASTEQALVISAIQNQQGFAVSLIEGVTGSGKTEVYLQIIEPVLQAGKQVLVMVPEIGLTPQTVERFQKRFNIEVGILHSGMNDNERLSVWQRAKAGELGVIIGTRSSVFTPLQTPGMIIIDEEHDSSYKQNDNFRYHARDVAIMRAKQSGIPLVLGSATPSLESLHNALQQRYRHFHLQQRAGNARKAQFNILDIRQQSLASGLAPATIKHLLVHLTRGDQVLIFLNRRGYAPALLCHQCGHVETCHHCDRPYTMHKQAQQLHCHHCGHFRRLPKTCSNCQSDDIAPLGLGTEQLEQGVMDLFPQYSSVRIDSDTMRGKRNLNNTLDAIHSGQHQILIGTQILAKGHHFPNVTMVVVVDIDGALFSADYRSAEQLAQLITQIGGRAGRASKAGEVWLQSHHPDHPLLQDLVHNGYGHFARLLLQERRYANLPPFSYQGLIRAESKRAEDAWQFLQSLLPTSGITEGVSAVGPMPALLEKRQGRYRFQLLLQSQSRNLLHNSLRQIMAQIATHPLLNKVKWSLDIDPQEFY